MNEILVYGYGFGNNSKYKLDIANKQTVYFTDNRQKVYEYYYDFSAATPITGIVNIEIYGDQLQYWDISSPLGSHIIQYVIQDGFYVGSQTPNKLWNSFTIPFVISAGTTIHVRTTFQVGFNSNYALMEVFPLIEI